MTYEKISCKIKQISWKLGTFARGDEEHYMKRTKLYSMTICALLFLSALILAISFCSFGKIKASAEDYRPGAIFSAGTNGTVGITEEGESDTRFVKLTLNAGGQVHYRRNLALRWYSLAQSSDHKNAGELHFFTLEFKFLETNFQEMTITFESSEENITKDAKSTNILHFYNQDGKIYVALQNSTQQSEDWTVSEEDKIDINYSDRVHITLSDKLGEEDCPDGEYALYINDVAIGKMTNVGGNYIEYLSSVSDTPRIPFTFKADTLSDGVENMSLIVYDLNGQSLAVNDAGRVNDTTPPVLVIDEKIYAYTLGKRWSLTYKAIDVCDETITVNRKFAMLKRNGESFEEPSDNDYKDLSTSSYFMPTSDDHDVEHLVSIYFVLDDGTFVPSPSDGQQESPKVYLSWYAADSALTRLGEGTNACDYIRVNRTEGGPSYIGLNAEEGENVLELDEEGNSVLEKLAQDYQAAVDKAAEGLSAGSGAYFYLPSLRGMITSPYTDYRNLSFTVYYRKQGDEAGSTAGSASSLKYNGLRFEITKEGKYVFKVMATDGATNSMQYYYEGKLQDLNSTNIWEIEEIPQFTFEASYEGATIKKPDDPAAGYSGQSYTFTDFTVVALEGYDKKYSLYKLDQDKIPSGVTVPTHETFMNNAELYFNQFKQYMTEIKKFNSNVSETDEERWENTDNDYHWDPDNALSFTPQEATYYILKLDVTESRFPGPGVSEYQVVDVRNKIDKLPEPPEWLQNNLVAVILFSISGVLLIALIVVALVKPSEKTVEEIDLESLKGGKKSKNNDQTEPDDKE